jgi:hypothetical protein
MSKETRVATASETSVAAAGGMSLPSSTANSEPSREVRQEPHRLVIDESRTVMCYANFCRVTGTPEELILDFAMNSTPGGLPEKIDVKQRLVVSLYTAKRMLGALSMAVQRHEAAFGMLETDVQKRVVGRRAVPSAGAPR